MYFHYGCGATQAGGAARARQSPYKPCLSLLPSLPPNRDRRGTRGTQSADDDSQAPRNAGHSAIKPIAYSGEEVLANRFTLRTHKNVEA